jgi:hypothetical protein
MNQENKLFKWANRQRLSLTQEQVAEIVRKILDDWDKYLKGHSQVVREYFHEIISSGLKNSNIF